MNSPLEYAIIGLLKPQPQSGYDLRKIFATTPMRHFSDSPGSIYPALRRLQARGWLAEARQAGSARGRQVFRVTRAGEQALFEWLQQPVAREDVIWRMDELLLRLAFLDGNVERRVTAKFLEELERALDAYTRELNEYAVHYPQNLSGTGALAFANGVKQYEAHLAWARRAQKEIAEASL